MIRCDFRLNDGCEVAIGGDDEDAIRAGYQYRVSEDVTFGWACPVCNRIISLHSTGIGSEEDTRYLLNMVRAVQVNGRRIWKVVSAVLT